MAAMTYLSRPTIALPVLTLVLGFFYLVGLAVYRLYVSPLAKFPGPKLAALSKWYEFYYEVVLKGQFTFRIQEMHRKYGPIVRITPEEIHIEDSDYWDTLYTRSERYDKYAWMDGRFGNNGSVFTTAKSDLHKIRRGALNPMFSKRSITKFQPAIRDKVSIICRRLAEMGRAGKEIRLEQMWSAFAGDVICEYSFGICYDHLESVDFKENFHEAFMAVSEFGHVALQFPWLHPLLRMIPDATNAKMNPPLAKLLMLQRDLRIKITEVANGKYAAAEHATIFSELLNSDLPTSEKALDRLGDEAQLILGAGVTTTAWALTTACYHIIDNATIARRLRNELHTVGPDADWLTLEKLPYLTACITEALRISYGVSARNPRISPTKPMTYKSWSIPAGTPVSMTLVDINHDEALFPDSRSYRPERWLDAPKAPDGSSLDRYFVTFGNDMRSCLGINLAYAELYHALAGVFRRFRFDLFETDFTDIELKHDFFLPSPRLDSKGVRVKVVEDS